MAVWYHGCNNDKETTVACEELSISDAARVIVIEQVVLDTMKVMIPAISRESQTHAFQA